MLYTNLKESSINLIFSMANRPNNSKTTHRRAVGWKEWCCAVLHLAVIWTGHRGAIVTENESSALGKPWLCVPGVQSNRSRLVIAGIYMLTCIHPILVYTLLFLFL